MEALHQAPQFKQFNCRFPDRTLTIVDWWALGRGLRVETPIDFRKFAEQCVHLAEDVGTLEHKAQLLGMAEVWIRLADKTDKVLALLDDSSS
jgi:hypothetical protein